MGRSRDREASLSSNGSDRTARSKKWDGDGGHRLHLSDLPVGVSKHEIEKLFRPYGELNEIWVASNPPCFAFINFNRRSDGERAMRELDGTTLAGTRIGLSWARPRHYGGRSRRRSPSPPPRRGYRDSYSSRRRHSRSRSRSPRHRRSGGGGGGGHRRRSRDSRSPSPRHHRREERDRPARREERRRRSSSPDERSPKRDNGKATERSPSNDRARSATPNGDNHTEVTEEKRPEVEEDAVDW